MKFKTDIILPKFDFEIDYSNKILLMGSCFSDNIGQKLSRSKFEIVSNPFGVIFNPISLCYSLDRLVKNQPFTERDIQQNNHNWFSYEAHGDFRKSSKDAVLKSLNNAQKKGTKFIQEADVLFLTLGTAWVYTFLETNQMVANCHKVPQVKFKKTLLKTIEIVSKIKYAIESLKELNPDIKFVLTVSPVRHLKDGMIDNQRSKAILIEAVHQIVESINNCYYFPSYEILMDDLRDYRFYTEDLVHPTPQAIEYVWEKFKDSFFTESTLEILGRIKKLKAALNHNIMDNESQEAGNFLKNLKENIDQLENDLPILSFKSEREQLENKVIQVTLSSS